jgi:hypothetical protein
MAELLRRLHDGAFGGVLDHATVTLQPATRNFLVERLERRPSGLELLFGDFFIWLCLLR